jgi:curli biogenesis system outer membrane secretion channel CsgG
VKKLFSIVKRGISAGTILTPHLQKDGCFVVSLSRFEKDYVRLAEESELMDWVSKGYSVRMSNPSVKSHRSPSLIAPSSIQLSE